jgi:hypothetical protein
MTPNAYRAAQNIVSALDRLGPSPLTAITEADGVPGSGTQVFAQAWAALTRGRYIETVGSLPSRGGRDPKPLFALTPRGQALALGLDVTTADSTAR